MPGVGVDPASAGASTRIAVVLYGYAQARGRRHMARAKHDRRCRWIGPPAADAAARCPCRGSRGRRSGVMLADYLSVSWAGGRPVPVISLAQAHGRSR